MPRNHPIRNCERCRRNDGCITFRGENWVICHRHRIRWRIDARTLDASSDRLDPGPMASWERVRRYRDVTRCD